MDRIRCNHCMTVFTEDDIIIDDGKELCPKCYTEGCLMDIPAITMVCAKCGGKDVRRNAGCVWSEQEQKWVLVCLFDSATCEDCEEECNIIEKEIPNDCC